MATCGRSPGIRPSCPRIERMPPLDGSANTIVDKLRWLAPAAAAMSYPFLLDGFHLAVSPAKRFTVSTAPDNWGGALPVRRDGGAALWPGLRLSNDHGGSVVLRTARSTAGLPQHRRAAVFRADRRGSRAPAFACKRRARVDRWLAGGAVSMSVLGSESVPGPAARSTYFQVAGRARGCRSSRG